MTIGLTTPNAQWRLLNAKEETAVLDLHPQALLILGFPNSPVLAEKVRQEANLWESLGKPKVLLRPYAPDIAERDPREWATICVGLWRWYASHDIRTELILANELNLEGMSNGWPRMAGWLVVLAEEVFRIEPGILLHLPALSPGIEGYRKGWEYLAGRQDILDFYPVIDAHVYSSEHLAALEYLHSLFPDHPIVITEWNLANWT